MYNIYFLIVRDKTLSKFNLFSHEDWLKKIGSATINIKAFFLSRHKELGMRHLLLLSNKLEGCFSDDTQSIMNRKSLSTLKFIFIIFNGVAEKNVLIKSIAFRPRSFDTRRMACKNRRIY